MHTMSEINEILAWTLVAECAVPEDVAGLLVNREVALATYKTLRDTAIFTNKRLIVKDAQGVAGKKVEIYSLPYSLVLMWSSENGYGLLDFTAELSLWTKLGLIKISLRKGIDVRRLERLLAEAMLQG